MIFFFLFRLTLRFASARKTKNLQSLATKNTKHVARNWCRPEGNGCYVGSWTCWHSGNLDCWQGCKRSSCQRTYRQSHTLFRPKTVNCQTYTSRLVQRMRWNCFSIQGSQFAIFRGGTFTPFLAFLVVFLPTVHQLRGFHSVFRAASPSQAMREDSKPYFECSIWILTVKCYTHGFSQCYNFQNQKITTLENIGYTELTSWHCYQGHMNE